MIDGCEDIQALFEAGTVPGKVPKVTGAPVTNVMEKRSHPFNVRSEMRKGYYLKLPRVPGAGSFAGFEAVESNLESSIRETAGRAVAAMWGGYLLGAVKLGFVSAGASLPVPALLAWITGTSNVQNTIVANYKTLGQRINTWATTYKESAARGYHLDANGAPGVQYTWAKWADYGKTLAGEVRYQTTAAWDSSIFVSLLDTVIATAKQVDPSNPSDWPTWLKVLVGAGAVVAGAYVVNSVVQAKRAFLPGANHG